MGWYQQRGRKNIRKISCSQHLRAGGRVSGPYYYGTEAFGNYRCPYRIGRLHLRRQNEIIT
jgi:hypothetical protein